VTPITCAASDASGNQSSATFRVTVDDTTPPTLTVPAPITAKAASPNGAVVAYKATASDAADPSPSTSCSPASGSTFPVGTTTVDCTATDSSGNSTSKSFPVDVTPESVVTTPPPPPPPATAPPPPPPSPPPGNAPAATVPGKDPPTITGPDGNPISLDQTGSIPPGSTVDVSGNAAIDLKDVSGKDMIFFGQNDGVPSTFVFKGITAGVVQLSLTGGAGSSRKVSVAGTHAKPKPKAPVRRLWGAGKGKFTTSGKYASATVRGTVWLVADYGDHTLITVKKGIVSVRDFVNKTTKLVPAGHSVIVYAQPVKKAQKKKAPKKKTAHKA
jgi:hypothetical protein